MTTTAQDKITLYYRKGSSDKVYQASIEPQDEGFVVNFAYGRRGSTLNTGSKTPAPVYYDAAKMIYDKLVREKQAKGYTEGEDGTPYLHTDKEQLATGILPQLLNPIEEDEVQGFIKDSQWCMQEKKDGKRVLLKKQGSTIIGINRKGLVIGLPSSIITSAQDVKEDFIMDGECVGDVLYAFDLLQLGKDSMMNQPYQHRLNQLESLLDNPTHAHIEFIETAYSSQDKEMFLKIFQGAKREGVVFKRLDAPYTPGRPSVGGFQVKYKFYATLTAVVSAINAKRSIQVQLLHDNQWSTAGNVTIPPNFKIPAIGAMVEIRYLYAFPESGVLYQPVYLGEREDTILSDCRASQLKFKPQEDEG